MAVVLGSSCPRYFCEFVFSFPCLTITTTPYNLKQLISYIDVLSEITFITLKSLLKLSSGASRGSFNPPSYIVKRALKAF